MIGRIAEKARVGQHRLALAEQYEIARVGMGAHIAVRAAPHGQRQRALAVLFLTRHHDLRQRVIALPSERRAHGLLRHGLLVEQISRKMQQIAAARFLLLRAAEKHAQIAERLILHIRAHPVEQRGGQRRPH